MSSARLDPTKVPSDLWARRIWVPLSGSKPSLVEVTDRKRLQYGAVIMLLGFAVVVAVKAMNLHWAFAVSFLILEVIGGLYITRGKRGGVYVLAANGSLGEYLGKNKPHLKSMRGIKPQ